MDRRTWLNRSDRHADPLFICTLNGLRGFHLGVTNFVANLTHTVQGIKTLILEDCNKDGWRQQQSPLPNIIIPPAHYQRCLELYFFYKDLLTLNFIQIVCALITEILLAGGVELNVHLQRQCFNNTAVFFFCFANAALYIHTYNTYA